MAKRIYYRIKNPSSFTPKRPGGFPSGLLTANVANAIVELAAHKREAFAGPYGQQYFDQCLQHVTESFTTVARCLSPKLQEAALNVVAMYAPDKLEEVRSAIEELGLEIEEVEEDGSDTTANSETTGGG